jgi:hypothetical protein
MCIFCLFVLEKSTFLVLLKYFKALFLTYIHTKFELVLRNSPTCKAEPQSLKQNTFLGLKQRKRPVGHLRLIVGCN